MKIMFALGLVAMATTASATGNDLRSSITTALKGCATARADANRDFARTYASRLRSYAKEAVGKTDYQSLVAEFFDTPEALACLEFSTGQKVVYRSDTATYLLSSRVISEQAARQRERREREEEARRKANIERVNSRVYSSCVKLAQRDNVAAFTNELCVASFKANGMPE